MVLQGVLQVVLQDVLQGVLPGLLHCSQLKGEQKSEGDSIWSKKETLTTQKGDPIFVFFLSCFRPEVARVECQLPVSRSQPTPPRPQSSAKKIYQQLTSADIMLGTEVAGCVGQSIASSIFKALQLLSLTVSVMLY